MVLEADLPHTVTWSPATGWLEASVRQPCCDGEVVATWIDPVQPLWPVGPATDKVFVTSQIPVVFETDKARGDAKFCWWCGKRW